MERIEEVILRDKFENIEEISEILEEEISSLARNFLLLNGDVKVRFKREKFGYVFNAEMQAIRIKPLGKKIN